MNKLKVLLVYPNLMLINPAPNNMAILSACLKEDGHQVKLFDATLYETSKKTNDELRVDRMQVRKFDFKKQRTLLNKNNIYNDFIATVENYNPDLIAVSVLDVTVNLGIKLIERVKSKYSQIPVIFGGVHAIFNAERLLGHQFIDMVCIGEGELVIKEVCKRLSRKQALNGVPSLWFKDKNGKIVRSQLGAPIDINNLPYDDFSIYDEQRFQRPMQGRIVKSIPITIDRGCPYQCTFCNAPSINQKYKKNNGKNYFRRKTIDRIYKEIKFQLSNINGLEYLFFNSETLLTMPINQLKEFANMYSEFNLPFWCQTRFETVTDDKIRILRQMNCDRISVGLEHGNEAFRRQVLKKTFSNNDVFNAFKIFNKYDMKVSTNNMLGFPGETRDLIFDTIKINRKIKSDSINGFVVQPYIGTEIYQYCIENGLLSNEKILTKTSRSPIEDPVVNMSNMTKEELLGLLRTFVLYVKMPKSFYPRIKVAERMNKAGNKELERLRQVLFKKYF
jgi:radical SAM superfamily enzyme YgiQ (UPF0313 family)